MLHGTWGNPGHRYYQIPQESNFDFADIELLGKLRAMRVERGCTPAEEAVAQDKADRLEVKIYGKPYDQSDLAEAPHYRSKRDLEYLRIWRGWHGY